MTGDLERCLYCEACKKPMGRMSSEELYDYWEFKDNPGLCFDCDPKSDIEVPPVLLPSEVGQSVVVDGLTFWCNRNANFDLRWRTISQDHKSDEIPSCLSSSTNLNIVLKKDSQDTVAFEEFEACPECAFWAKSFSNGDVLCGRCDFLGAAMVDTLVGLGVLPPIDSLEDEIAQVGDCPDCMSSRLLGMGKYCIYHHALLIEQYGDGSLGWDNA